MYAQYCLDKIFLKYILYKKFYFLNLMDQSIDMKNTSADIPPRVLMLHMY